MPFVPVINNYKPFYIQTASDEAAWDTRAYGIVAQEQPFPDNYAVKDPYKNDWHDENGDEEYTASMQRKAFEYTMKLFIQAFPDTTNGISAIGVLNSLRESFRNKITSGEFKIWDSWQERGFQGVRFVKDDVEKRVVSDDVAWMVFSITLKVNDPSTAVSYANGVISAV